MKTSRSKLRVYQLLVLVLVIGTWHVLTSPTLLPPFYFSNPDQAAFFFGEPWKVFVRVVEWFATGEIFVHLGVTMFETVAAFAIGTVGGLAVGMWLALSPTASAILDPYVKAANSMPRVILAPIFSIWFGLGVWSKVALGVTVVFFIVFFNTYQGVKEVDTVVLNNARMLGASERDLLRHVLIPSALTWIFSSLHISIGFAIIAVVVGEYLGASRGVGYMIAQAEGVFDTTGVFAGMTVLAAVVLLVGAGVTRLERWLQRWKPDRETSARQMG